LVRTAGWPFDPSSRVATYSRWLLIAGALFPLVILSVWQLVIHGQGVLLPNRESLFSRIGPLASYAVPLVLAAMGLAGHALREKFEGYRFSAGAILNLALTGTFVTAVTSEGRLLNAADWVRVVQIATIVAACWSAVWLAEMRWRTVTQP